MSDKIAQIALGLPIPNFFDYSVPGIMRANIDIGCRVRISFNRRSMVGYVVNFSAKSKFSPKGTNKLKPILKLIDSKPIISKDTIVFLSSLANYYCASLGEMIEAALPALLREGNLPCALEQRDGSSKVEHQSDDEIFLPYVFRVTDESKKIEFFKQKIRQTLEKKRQVILLVPDTSLVEFWHERLKEEFKDSLIVTMHSRLTKNQACFSWCTIKFKHPDIVIGSRSAIFSPIDNIGLIILDSEDNFVYKQETRPFYNARDVAIMLAKLKKSTLILSSVSPSLEVFSETLKNNFKIVSEDLQSVDSPIVKIIDLKRQLKFKKANIISLALLERLRLHLEQKKKVLLFLNRKGFATYARCRHCAYQLKCERCSSNLIYYYQQKIFSCPHCNFKLTNIDKCPKCALDLINFGGVGVERLESEAHRLFPGSKITRLDSLNNPNDIASSDIIISTQLGLKGLINQRIDLCAIVSIDSILNLAQLRSCEESFRILMSLHRLVKEELIIQTYHPEHRVFQNIINADYVSFAKQELKDRRILKLPPYKHLISINLRSPIQEKLATCAQALFLILAKEVKKIGDEIFQPVQDVPYKLRSKFRLFILIKTVKVEETNKLIIKTLSKLRSKQSVILSVNVDP
jgi:primosomal protein N' (replication factor Y)